MFDEIEDPDPVEQAENRIIEHSRRLERIENVLEYAMHIQKFQTLREYANELRTKIVDDILFIEEENTKGEN